MQAQVLYLPHDFPGELDLNEVNARLRSGEISLDWSHVPFDLLIERVSLERLFAGLDLVEHAEAIGSATIPATLQPLVLDIFATRQTGETTFAAEQTPTEDRSTPCSGCLSKKVKSMRRRKVCRMRRYGKCVWT